MTAAMVLPQGDVALSDEVRRAINARTPDAYRSTALPKMLKLLVNNTSAQAEHARPATAAGLLQAISEGDRSAETALYVRAAPELDRIAARAVGSSAMDREDLHQEGAERLIRDARVGKITADFGGSLSPYLWTVVLGHLRNIASTQAWGKPTDPGRLTQKLREALRKTVSKDGEYDLIKAAAYAHAHFSWTLATFWTVHRMMFSATDDMYQPTGTGYSTSETLADPVAADTMNRVEIVHSVRRILESEALKPQDREVLRCLYGIDGPVLSQDQTAKVLGVSQQMVSKTKGRALNALAGLAHSA